MYNKDLLLDKEARNKSNLFLIFRMYGILFNDIKKEIVLSKKHVNLEHTRDEALYNNFGFYFDFKSSGILYRRILESLFKNLRYQGTPKAVKELIKSITGISPIITKTRDILNFVIYDKQTDEIGNILPNRSYLYENRDTAYKEGPFLFSKWDAAFGIFIKVLKVFPISNELKIWIKFLLNKIIPSHIIWSISYEE